MNLLKVMTFPSYVDRYCQLYRVGHSWSAIEYYSRSNGYFSSGEDCFALLMRMHAENCPFGNLHLKLMNVLKKKDFRSAIKSCFLFGSHQAHEPHILLQCKLDFSVYRIITQVISILNGTVMDCFISRERVRTIKLKRRHLEGFKLDQSM